MQALRPPIAKIGPMAAPQRDGLVAPMPAFAAGGPMPAADAPLAIALEYAACEDLPQVGARCSCAVHRRLATHAHHSAQSVTPPTTNICLQAPPAKRKYVRRKPAGPRQPPAGDAAPANGHGAAVGADGCAVAAPATNGVAASSGGEEALGVGRRHRPRKLLYGGPLSCSPHCFADMCSACLGRLLVSPGLLLFQGVVRYWHEHVHCVALPLPPDLSGCLAVEDAGDYLEEDPFSHKRPRKSNYYDWKVRSPHLPGCAAPSLVLVPSQVHVPSP